MKLPSGTNEDGPIVTVPTPNAPEKRQALTLALSRGFFSAPGVFDGISARVADSLRPAALYMSGYGTVASHLGLPDAGLATYTDMVGRAAQIARMTSAPLIADGDTGYGGLLNVQHTVRGYEQAGVAAIQLEDQEIPKKCGHTPGRRVVPAADMAAKVRVAVENRDSKDFLIIARTDARTTHGLDEALRRAERYAEAGADILFVEAPESEDEMARICATLDKPVLANIIEGGRTPNLSAARLTELGFAFAIYPVTGFLAAAEAMRRVYAQVLETGGSSGSDQPLADFEAFSKLMGFETIWAFDRRYAQSTNDE